jgi:hypothetical protein
MGYFLLLIESLTFALLLTATVLACGGRPHRNWLRLALGLPVTLALAFAYTALTVGAAFLQFSGTSRRWFYPMLALTVAYLVGAVWIWVRALRAVGDEPRRAAAAAWPCGKLAIALGIVAALHAMTLWNMDLAARQQLASLRTEAGALALSVTPPRIADRDNAALVYQQAFEAMGRYDDDSQAVPGAWEWEPPWKKAWEERWTRWDETGGPALDPRDAELRRFLSRQAAALTLFRQAAARSGCYFDRDYGRPTLAMRLPELLLLRQGARLLALDAICSAADKNHQRAIADIHAMFGMAEHVRSESLLISMLVAMVVDRLAIDSLQIVLASTDVPARELPAQWGSGDVSYRTSFGRALRMEEALRLATFAQVGEGQYGLAEIAAAADGGRSQTESARSTMAWGYRIFLLAEDLAAHTRFTTDVDTMAHLPYWKARDCLREVEGQMQSHPGGLMTSMLAPALSRVVENVAVADARRAAARVGLALYRYRAQHGRFPEKAADLAPEFIAGVPADPFDGKPLRVKQTVHGATVYSVGAEVIERPGEPWVDINKKHRDVAFTVPARVAAKK